MSYGPKSGSTAAQLPIHNNNIIIALAPALRFLSAKDRIAAFLYSPSSLSLLFYGGNEKNQPRRREIYYTHII